jgi:hypothetical protein
MLGVSLLAGVATPARADRDDKCRRDVRKAEENLEKAVRAFTAWAAARPSSAATSSNKSASVATGAIRITIATTARPLCLFGEEYPFLPSMDNNTQSAASSGVPNSIRDESVWTRITGARRQADSLAHAACVPRPRRRPSRGGSDDEPRGCG